MMSLHFCDDVPFHTVYVHGLVRDGEGQKMSKSKGNVIDPIDLIDGIGLEELVAKRTSGMMQPQMAAKIEKATRKHFPDGIVGYGTDALRFTFYSLASTGRDIKFDIGRMEGYRNFCNKIWNAARYVLMNCEGHDFSGDAVHYSLADRWIRSRFQRAAEETARAIDAYRLDFATQALYDFVWNEYCDWYLELSKPVLWDEAGDPSLIAGTRKTLIEILEQTLRLLHPLMPYITEEIWQSVAPIAGNTGKTIMLQGYPLADADMIDEEAEAEIGWLKQLIVAIRTVRSEANLAPSLELNVLIKNTSASDRERMERNAPFLKKLAKTASLEALDSDDGNPPALSALCGHMEILVPMAGVIDIEAELARLSKEHEKQKSEVQRLKSKLENPKFINRAPTDVVDKEREKLGAASDALGKLEEQVKRIQGLR